MGDDYFTKTFLLPPVDESQEIPSAFHAAPVSPYLNFDSRYFQQAPPEFIMPEGAAKQRGRFQLAFSHIGSSVLMGGSIGSVAGIYNGMKVTSAQNQYGKLRRTQLLNHAMKQGSGTANTLGTLAVLYSACGVFLQYVRNEDDNLNTLLSGTATGMIYKSTAGLRKCAMGGVVGLALSSLFMTYFYMQEKAKREKPKYF